MLPAAPVLSGTVSADRISVEVHDPEGRWLNVVRGVSLTLQRGEITALVGETGSGKTLTALSMIGLLPEGARLISGQVLLDGRDLAPLRDSDMMKIRGRRISMIFQDPLAALNPVRTVGFHITEPLVVHFGLSRREARRRAVRLLEQVGMSDPVATLRRYPHELSGGMRQRALIAVALACDPDVLLADEPTTALDVTIQAQILKLLRDQVRDRGLAVLFVTHDLGVAAEIADRIAVMYAGAIVEYGPTSEVLGHPGHPYTIGLIGCVPRVDLRRRPLPTLPGGIQGVWDIRSGCRFAPRCSYAIQTCREAEPRLAEVGPGHVSACWVLAPPPDDAR